jgi:hypothetical protein
MIDASTLEDRTRPVVEPSGWMSKRLRYLQWPGWSSRVQDAERHQVRASDARLGRR